MFYATNRSTVRTNQYRYINVVGLHQLHLSMNTHARAHTHTHTDTHTHNLLGIARREGVLVGRHEQVDCLHQAPSYV